MPNKLCLLAISLVFAACASGPGTKSPPEESVADEQMPAEAETPQLSALQMTQLKNAVTRLNAGETGIARKSLAQLEKSAPANSLVLSNLAAAFFREGKPEDATEYAKKALKIDQNNAQAYNILGLLAVEKGDISKAEEAYIKALTLDKNFANAHFNLALVYDIYYQDLGNAIRHYQAYLTLIDFQDERTLEWVQELERSLENQ